MTRSYVQWGISALNDEPLLSVSSAAQGAFPWLLIQAALSDGNLPRMAAVVFLRGRGWADAEATVDELIAAGLIVGGRMSGWDKYQASYVLTNEQRATTREGRRLGLSREADDARKATVAASTSNTAHVDGFHTTPHVTRVDTVEAATRGVPSPLFFSPLGGDTTEKETTQKTARFSPGDDSDRDIQDTLYELTFLRPWGKEWGQRALSLVGEFGSDADPTMRQIAKEKPGTKPWDLVRLTADRLERDRDKAKSRERHEAGRHRAARANGGEPEAGRITVEEYERLATTYKEPMKNNG